ncbi:CLUMA_CG020778, isoform A [Clunio marinus]|uniref:CLUMA_CG020778, isoform A n=1 Tax=Clunio marinus TaxID=568069 RepID=A0A1J1J600_9DIPT|nr:CLUMA_CG020778, isoform A [Clunio marinus]
MKLLLLFLLSFCFLKVNLAANILCLFSKPAHSHQLVYRSITEKLLEAVHKITLMTTHPSESEKRHVNLTLIDVYVMCQSESEIKRITYCLNDYDMNSKLDNYCDVPERHNCSACKAIGFL